MSMKAQKTLTWDQDGFTRVYYMMEDDYDEKNYDLFISVQSVNVFASFSA